MLMKIQNQIGHLKLLNALAVSKASFPKKANHYWCNIMLYFLANVYEMATFTRKCSTV